MPLKKTLLLVTLGNRSKRQESVYSSRYPEARRSEGR